MTGKVQDSTLEQRGRGKTGKRLRSGKQTKQANHTANTDINLGCSSTSKVTMYYPCVLGCGLPIDPPPPLTIMRVNF